MSCRERKYLALVLSISLLVSLSLDYARFEAKGLKVNPQFVLRTLYANSISTLFYLYMTSYSNHRSEPPLCAD